MIEKEGERPESERIQKYFEKIEDEVKEIQKIAKEARKKGFDPEKDTEVPIAKNMAERVIGLISVVAPQIINTPIATRIQELEKEYGNLDWRVAFKIAEEIAQQKYCKFKDQIEAMEVGIRVGFAYITLGTVSSPLEGFDSLEVRKRMDGKEYIAIKYAGPIRSAGATMAAASCIMTDYVRKQMGYEAYDPTEQEIKRASTELYDYHERVSNLQYLPSKEEIEFLAKNIPVQVDGDPSEKIDVSNYKDLPRIATNTIRNGACLVVGECICQKAPKLWKQLQKWGKDFGMEQWNFLEEFIKIQKRMRSGGAVQATGESKEKILPDFNYIKDLPAGRPVLCHPKAPGGFRLRYGRSRASGLSSMSISPLTMLVLNDFIGVGTQIKYERPGKSTAVAPCDTIEGPIVKIDDGSVIRIEKEEDARRLNPKIVEILFLGDMLVNYGEFLNRNHILAPPGYCEEWWALEVEKATVDMFGNLDLDKLSELTSIPKESLEIMLRYPLKTKVTSEAAIQLSQKLSVPLHPRYTYYWNLVKPEQFTEFLDWMDKARIEKESDNITKVVIPYQEKPKRVMELIGIPHIVVNKEFVVIEKEDANAVMHSLNIFSEEDLPKLKSKMDPTKDVLTILNENGKIRLRDRGGLFIGGRMGRPEKAKMRKLTGSPQVLFPVGEEGGRLRCFQAAFEAGTVNADFPIYICAKCNKETIFPTCDECGNETKKMYHCKTCGLQEKNKCQHGDTHPYRKKNVDIKALFSKSLKHLKMQQYPDLIKGVRGTSNKDHTPENLAKGILRAKHDIYVNKDGTIRYDLTEMPITHFRPKEGQVSVEKLRKLGYEKDIHGKELTDENQLLEILPQDILIPACKESPDEGADEVFFRIANFVDDLLVNFYGQKPYYNLSKKEDLIGHLVVGLAPHTSAGIVGRIIGFTKTQGCFSNPVWHAEQRRDCEGDETCIILLADLFLNFSRRYLPAHRGSTQDAPLVLTTKLIPSEADDMIFDMDTVWRYPLEFYNSACEYKSAGEVKIETLKNRLGGESQYEGIGFTHDTTSINMGIRCSSYKTLPTMEDKLKGQMNLAEKIRAVDTADVARLVIEKHFLKDTKGNLRKFSMQEFRCVKCNEKFRRPPLIGKCTNCGGKILFTISEGSVIKYLEPSISLAEKYNATPYLKQTLELLKRRVEGVFGKDKEKQEGLGKWFG